jgi:hypothetical protein
VPVYASHHHRHAALHACRGGPPPARVGHRRALLCMPPLIVGLNVATKGAPPFSRGKQVVPGKQDVPHYTKITMRSQILILHYTTQITLK